MTVIGLDVGGANLKAADGQGNSRLIPFALWRNPNGLADQLRQLLDAMPPHDLVAVTMTGELCDCYETKRQGVLAILDAVAVAAGQTPVRVWTLDGRFVDLDTARKSPLKAASANWLALATFAGRFAPSGIGLLIDIGSTTTDVIPLRNGKPIPLAFTDRERLKNSELVYTGIRRTPLCTVLPFGEGAAELFATTLDLYLILGMIPEEPHNRETADGRPATKAFAHARLARMVCADSESFSASEATSLAHVALARHVYRLQGAFDRVVRRFQENPQTVILAGSGEFLARLVLEQQTAQPPCKAVRLESVMNPGVSHAACAHAVAVLAVEEGRS